MRVLPPIDLFTSALVTASSIAEPDATQGEATWSGATNYALAAEAISTATHRKYRSLQAANLNHPLPNYTIGETENDWWVDIGPTNKYAMFDYNRTTTSIDTSPLSVTIAPGQRVDSLALLGMQATQVTISATSVLGGGTVYGPEVVSLRRRSTRTWSDYFFGAFREVPSIILTDLPQFSDLIVTVEFENASDNVRVGTCAIGKSIFLGDIEYNPISDAINFSEVNRNDFGDAQLTQRRSIPKTTQKVFADTDILNSVRQARTDLNAQVAVWFGLDDEDDPRAEALLILGFYRTWTIDLVGDDVFEQNIEIEEF